MFKHIFTQVPLSERQVHELAAHLLDLENVLTATAGKEGRYRRAFMTTLSRFTCDSGLLEDVFGLLLFMDEIANIDRQILRPLLV